MSIGFACPTCGAPKTDVKDSRPREAGGIRRRRTCGCGHRFTTYEFAADDIAGMAETAGPGAPEIAQQAKAIVGILPQLTADDRLLVMSMARRLAGGEVSWRAIQGERRAAEGVQ